MNPAPLNEDGAALVGDGAAVVVRGAPTPDEIAAVLAALARRPIAGPDDPYERWRRGRIAARSRGADTR